MIKKKVLTVNRDTGKLLSTQENEPANISEEKYYKPFIDLYKEGVDRLRYRGEDKP